MSRFVVPFALAMLALAPSVFAQTVFPIPPSRGSGVAYFRCGKGAASYLATVDVYKGGLTVSQTDPQSGRMTFQASGLGVTVQVFENGKYNYYYKLALGLKGITSFTLRPTEISAPTTDATLWVEGAQAGAFTALTCEEVKIAPPPVGGVSN